MKGFTQAVKQKKKTLGYRTPDRFKRQVFRRRPMAAATARPRALGGHQ